MARKAQANEQLDIDTFIFANVLGQDPAAPIDRDEGVPPVAQQVHQQQVQQYGRISDNIVVYSTVLSSTTGPFEFNWLGLYSSVNQTLVAIQHVPTVAKTVTAPGVAGNTLNRNFGIEYSGIAELTGINVAPETWQLDFTARLSGMDELTRQLAADMNGKDWFIGDGFKVVPRATLNTFSVTPGVGYVSGLRIELENEAILTAQSYPLNVYVDAWFDGTSQSIWRPQTSFTVTATEMDDYIDVNGQQHYVFKLAIISAANAVKDFRSVSGLEQITSYTLDNRQKLRTASLVKINTEKGYSRWSAKAPIIILGDSISHGAFALSNFYNSYVNILGRMLNSEYGGGGYNGFVNLANLGSGETISRDVHGVNFFGSWNNQSQLTTNGQFSYAGTSWQTISNGASISIICPSFQKRAIIWYLQQPGGGELTIKQNGINPVVINTDGVLTVKSQYLNIVDGGYGDFEISMTKTDSTEKPIDVIGIGYVNDEVNENTVHNFSNSGRRLRYVPETTISDLTNNASMFVLALGVNDYADVDVNPDGDYAAEFSKRINWIIQHCISKQTFLVVNDMCWSAGSQSFTRSELKRAAFETDGLYIGLPDLIKNDGTTPDASYLVNTVKMFSDAIHPNVKGHKWIAETIAKNLSLSVTSKKDAISYHDYWIPFLIPTSGNVKNRFTSPELISGYKINGSEVRYKVAVNYKDSASAFPVGSYILQSEFRKFNNISAPFNVVDSTVTNYADIRQDTGAISGLYMLQNTGSVTLKIIDGTWLNYQQSTSCKMAINVSV